MEVSNDSENLYQISISKLKDNLLDDRQNIKELFAGFLKISQRPVLPRDSYAI